MHELTLIVEKKIKDTLPDFFALVFDGWTLDGTSTHYVGIFATFLTSKGTFIYDILKCSFISLSLSIFPSLYVPLFNTSCHLIFEGTNERVLLGFSPLLDETEFTADNHLELIEEILERFGKGLKNVVCFVADNCATNVSIAKKAVIPLIGILLLINQYLIFCVLSYMSVVFMYCIVLYY